jgi:hypothetical protein
MKKQPGDLRSGDKAELEALLESRGDVLRRARIRMMRDEEIGHMLEGNGQSRADYEGRRMAIKAYTNVLALEQRLLKEYEDARAAGNFAAEDDED